MENMNLSDPKIIYMLIALPILFGLTLLGDGIDKIVHGQGGWISLVTGISFLIVAALIAILGMPAN